jgi:hypothetical protein
MSELLVSTRIVHVLDAQISMQTTFLDNRYEVLSLFFYI